MYSIQFGQTRILYQLRRSNRQKSVHISVDPTGNVVVTAPFELQIEAVRRAVSQKAKWINGKLDSLIRVKNESPVKEFVSGESFSYLGRNYRLKVVQHPGNQTSVSMKCGRFEIAVDTKLLPDERKQEIRTALSRWYKRHAAARLPERVALLTLRLGVPHPPIWIREQQKRWASCSTKGEIRFNWRIIMAPISLIDYVVAHELCHLLHHDHSPEFWKLLRIIVPDYESRRDKLRREGSCFSFE